MAQKVIVIGGGPAGIEAGRAAAEAGAQVTIVSEGAVGGRAGWHSLLPSKVWLTAADTLGELTGARALGLAGDGGLVPDAPGVLERIQSVAAAWNGYQLAHLEKLGVNVVSGHAVFASATEVIVKDPDADMNEIARLDGDSIIVASGSGPVFPPDLKPDGKQVLAPRFASKLDSLPESVVVIGAGATGTEFVYLFNGLGLPVTWIVDEFGVLPGFKPQVGRYVADTLIKRGVTVVRGRLAMRIEQQAGEVVVVTDAGSRHPAAMAFVAIGRKADTGRFNIEAAGLSPNERGDLEIDAYCRTAVPHIYAVGDVTGGPMLANKAVVQAWIAGRHAAGVDTAPYRPETVVSAIYSEPQAAQVGDWDDEARTIHLSYEAALKAHLAAEGEGFIELAYDPHDRRVLGAVAAGHQATGILAPVAMAIQMQATLDDLAAVGGAYPTLSELAFTAARLA